MILPGLGDGLSPVRGKMQGFDRFPFQATSCVHHNAYSELVRIVCPTLIVGSECDKIVGTVSSVELAEKIKVSYEVSIDLTILISSSGTAASRRYFSASPHFLSK